MAKRRPDKRPRDRVLWTDDPDPRVHTVIVDTGGGHQVVVPLPPGGPARVPTADGGTQPPDLRDS